MFVRWLPDITLVNRPLVGGKALALAELARLDLPVPPAFVVTTEAYTAAAGRAEWPPEVHVALTAALESLRESVPHAQRLIVRSSAPFEDSAAFSAAGQLASYSTASDLASVLATIRRCWAALESPALRSYYAFAGGKSDPALAVIVQALIDTDAAGVMFTCGIDAPDSMVIEAARGPSDAVTSGTVTPERTLLDCHTGQVIAAPQVEQPILSADDLRRLAAAGQRLETHYGTPQDVEWGFAGGRLYVFQSRPVTVSARASGNGVYTTPSPDESIRWVSGFFEERFPDAVSPLTWSYLFPAIIQAALVEPLGFIGVQDVEKLPICRLYQGRVYTNVAVFQMLYKFFPPGLVPDDARRYFPGGDVRLRRDVDQPHLHHLIGSVLKTMVFERGWHPWNYRVWRGFVPEYRQALDALAAQLDAAPDGPPLLGILDGLLTQTIRLLRLHRWSLTYAEVFSTLAGQPSLSAEDSPTMRNDRQLRAVAQRARELGLSPHTLADEAGRVPELDAMLRAFLAEFGHRSFSLDLLSPRYADDPAQVWASVAGLMEHEGPVQRSEPDAAGRSGPLTFFARRYVALREEQRFEWQRTLHLMRRAFTRLEARCIAQGVLRQPGDIFFLRWDELQTLVRGRTLTAAPAALAAERQRAFRRIRYAPFPRFVQGDFPVDAAPAAAQLHGIGASGGQAQGAARVILHPESLADLLDRLGPEDAILVTRATDPGWTPAFGHIRAIVMQVGGQLSHGAIVAREYGIPAVVGVGDAIYRIQDGDHLAVDGDTGAILILEAGEN